MDALSRTLTQLIEHGAGIRSAAFAVACLSACLLVLQVFACGPPFTSGCGSACPDVPSCVAEQCLDCEFIAQRTEDVSLVDCQSCQGVACGPDELPPEPCCDFPCREGQVVIRACDCDDDCEGIAPFCGRYASRHRVCQVADPR
jgi:hypothetical protein